MHRVFLSSIFALASQGCVSAPPAHDAEPSEQMPMCDPNTPVNLEFSRSPGGTPEVSAAQVRASACGLRVVDVREAEELSGKLGVIEGAEHIPQRRVLREALAWDRNAPVILVCRSGRRSGMVARELQELGFTRVASLTGGMLSWHALGFPTMDASSVESQRTSLGDAAMRVVSREDVAAHIADRNQVRWAKAATLLMHGTQACVDGRDAHAIIGTPGGDAGELVLALAAAERRSGRPFSEAEVGKIFDDYIVAFGHFYLHSDEDAVAELLAELAVRVRGPDYSHLQDPLAAARFVQDPPVQVRDELIGLVADPSFTGCGHLRLMLENADEYGVRAELVASVIRAFYRRLWAGQRELEFVVLGGGHEESAVVTIELPTEVRAYTRVPLVSPRLRDTEVFVAHPQVARFIRRENAAFLIERAPALREVAVDEEAFLTDLERLAEQQLKSTLTRLAPRLPHYRVRFSGEEFQVIGPDSGS